MATKYVYSFGGGKADGGRDDKEILGGKGANLAEMTAIGLPVPPGFTIGTHLCMRYLADGSYPPELEGQVRAALARVEAEMGARFGDAENPLLVSVRSGARESMPGMMDTVLNLGLNDTTVEGLARRTGNPRFAYDCYRRFIAMYGDVVMGVRAASDADPDPFEQVLHSLKLEAGVHADGELGVMQLKALVDRYKALIRNGVGRAFPEDPHEQLWGAVGAVFRSWTNDRAATYRRMYNIPDDWGTAVNVVAMVYGNMGDDSGTGVAFTRDPASGENVFFGEYLYNAQGEDVVAGTRTPLPIAALERSDPGVYRQLLDIRATLERHYRDMQDIEFTVQRGRLFMLQTRNGKRTGFAAVRIAVDMLDEGLIAPEEAVLRIDPDAVNHLLQPVFDAEAKRAAVRDGRVLGKGLAAGPGAAGGRIVLSSERCEALKARNPGVSYVLVRNETSPEDIKGMHASAGILTARGGMTSHAALVARQMGRVCVVGCTGMEVDAGARTVRFGERLLNEGDELSIDGFTGEVLAGVVATKPSEVVQALVERTIPLESSPTARCFDRLMRTADGFRTLKVRANADQPDQAANAVALGAEGIGLCRTEHMFFGEGKIDAFREMIVARSPGEREAALAHLLPLQRADFRGIFEAMAGRPVTIRTLDPPLHEFLPHTDEDVTRLAKRTGLSEDVIRTRAAELHEANPMLGHRGCRLGISYPEITAMQARAIFEAAVDVVEAGGEVRPEIMIPLVGHLSELDAQARTVREAAEEVFARRARRVDYLLGTMIELPRAALTADEIARTAEFFSFGTNDLTQTTLGLSRDDSATFLPLYLNQGLLADDPFATIDRAGVGKLMRIAVDGGRATRPHIKLGICGEHGGDPKSVAFCHELGLDYVSCSPFRVPVARLAAARSALRARVLRPTA